LILLALLGGDPFFDYPPKTYVLFILLAVVPQLIGHTSLNWALKFFSATLVAVFILGEPIGASILAYLLLGEPWAAICSGEEHSSCWESTSQPVRREDWGNSESIAECGSPMGPMTSTAGPEPGGKSVMQVE